MRTPKRFSIPKCLAPQDRAMLDARFSHLYLCQSLRTLQRGLSAITDLLVIILTMNWPVVVVQNKTLKC